MRFRYRAATIAAAMSLPHNPFARAAQMAVASALELPAESFSATTPPRPELGDFAVGCFPAAKARRAAPAAIAAEVAGSFTATDMLASAEASGPFVNFRIARPVLFSHLVETAKTGSLLPQQIGAGKTICIDFSSPNISKHLAYHHIRSTVIGHALVNLYRSIGYQVVGINHLGDWGTTHGMLLAAYKKWGAEEPLNIDVLNALYVKYRAAIKEEAKAIEESGEQRANTFDDAGRAWFLKLEQGDEEARRLWQRFRDVSWEEFATVYKTLGITFDEVKGESSFAGDIADVISMLADKKLSSESDGALVVSLEDLDLPPLLLKKRDGATLYATRDIAAAIHRWENYQFERSLYVVDRGQGLHFKQLFTVLERAGLDWAKRCTHVPFGLVRIGGKKTGTRSGNVVLLKDVLTDATARAKEQIEKSNERLDRGMDADALDSTAKSIGVGAVVFANLVSARIKDVDFEWEDVLATNGDTGVYVQYGHARCAQVLAKAAEAGLDDENAEVDWSALEENNLEWAIGKQLSDYVDVIDRAAHANDPHILSRYLLDLVAAYSRWYTQGNGDPALRILCEDRNTRRARLQLVEVVKSTLASGLGILGIDAPNSM